MASHTNGLANAADGDADSVSLSTSSSPSCSHSLSRHIRLPLPLHFHFPLPQPLFKCATPTLRSPQTLSCNNSASNSPYLSEYVCLLVCIFACLPVNHSMYTVLQQVLAAIFVSIVNHRSLSTTHLTRLSAR